MPRQACCAPPVLRAAKRNLIALLLTATLAACGGSSGSVPTDVAANLPRPPREALPLEQATLALGEAALAATRSLPPGERRTIVIDPLLDRASGTETGATRSMVSRISTLIRERYPSLELKPFTLAALDEKPLILLGAITPVSGAGSLQNADGRSDVYRIWAVLGDLRTGRVLVHPTAWVRAATVDVTPARFFRDSPAWTDDTMAGAYLRTCAGAPGAAMDPVYLAGLRAQAATAEAILAYESGNLAEARSLYGRAAAETGGNQARVLNGLYLTSWALGDRNAAETAFGRLVDYGLERRRLAVKLLFRPGGTDFVRDTGVSAPYPMFIRQIADHAAAKESCILVVGHASVTGTSTINDRLSLQRAQRVRERLVTEAPGLDYRSAASGRGSREPIVGTGTDDMRDALDRRVEFVPRTCRGATAT